MNDFFILNLLLIILCAHANTLEKSDTFVKNSHKVKRQAENAPTSLLIDKQTAAEANAPSSRLRRDDESSYEMSKDKYRQAAKSYEKTHNRKRSAIENELNLKKEALRKRNILGPNYRRDTAYGIVYGNGKPVGILEPYPQAYELAPFENNKEGLVYPRSDSNLDLVFPLKRDASHSDDDSSLISDQSAAYNDERYPSVLANFKIDNRMKEKRVTEETMPKLSDDDKPVDKRQAEETKSSKRSPITDAKIYELKTALNKIQNPNPSDNIAEIEENLRGILEDMGLIDDDKLFDAPKNKRETEKQNTPEKREADKEDENMENGANKIELKKETHDDSDRKKREESKNAEQIDLLKLAKSEVKEPDKKRDCEKSTMKSIDDPTKKDVSASKKETEIKRQVTKVANYQKEGEAFIRSKRQQLTEKAETSEIMKGLEKSGDLTVSGNKSPLASSNEEEEENKSVSSVTDKQKRDEDDLNYEKRIERNLQAKIDAIKDEVKREIAAMKAKGAMQDDSKDGVKRKKRDVANTLLDGETLDLDPNLKSGEAMIPHIRRRRNLDTDFAELLDPNEYFETKDQKKRDQNAQLEKEKVSKRSASISSNQDSERNQEQKISEGSDEVQKKRSAQESSSGEKKIVEISKESSEKKRSAEADALKTQENPLNQENGAPKKRSVEEEALDSLEGSQNQEKSSKKKRGAEGAVENLDAPQKQEETPEEKRSIEENISDKQDSVQNALEKKRNILEEVANVRDSSQRQERDFQKKRNTREELLKDLEVLRRRKKSVDGMIRRKKSLQEEEKEDEGAFRQAFQNLKRREIALSDSKVPYTRRKRADGNAPENSMAYMRYRAEGDEVDDEGDEFDDDGFDDRTSNLVRKRQAYDDYYPNQRKRAADYDYEAQEPYYQKSKRHTYARDFVADLNADVDDPASGNYLYDSSSYARKKRQGIDELAAIHGGGPMLKHLAAIRERNLQAEDMSRRKRNNKLASGRIDHAQKITDLSDTDLFGALPQSYEGELSRFKRVKRGSKQSKVPKG